jgi:ClpP class serine protease
MADISHKALGQMKEFVETILSGGRSREDIRRIVEALTEGRRTHDHPIFLEDAKSLGINVTEHIPGDIYRLVELFIQPDQQRPSVQYVPVPYKSDEQAGE